MIRDIVLIAAAILFMATGCVAGHYHGKAQVLEQILGYNSKLMETLK